MGKTYHELNPLIRVKELELLTSADMQKLLTADSIEAVGEILESTIYADYIQPDFQLSFERNLDLTLAKLYDELLEIVPEPEVVWIYTMRYTFHNLKVFTKAELVGGNYDHLFIDDGFYTLKEIKRAIHTGFSTHLPQSIIAAIVEVKEYFEEANNLQGIDVIYDRNYLKEQRAVGERLQYPELLEEIISFIDLTNVNICGRCLLQERSQAFMTTVLSSSGDIPKDDFLAYSDRSFAEFTDFLLTTKYADLVNDALVAGTLNLAQLEKNKDDYLTHRFDLAAIQAFGPLPLLAFLNAKEIEIKNLRLIVVGKANGFKQEQLQERMRNVYGT